jgi:hypothetical protein
MECNTGLIEVEVNEGRGRLMAPSVPKALELYLKMMEGLDFKWSVGSIGEPSIMNTPLARMAYSIEETVPCDRFWPKALSRTAKNHTR